jgi:hypothetical protein
MTMRPRNPFGSSTKRPVQEAPEELEAEGLYGDEVYGGPGEAPADEDPELPGTGSLASISIHRKKDGAVARPAAQPRASVPKAQETPPRNIVEFWSRMKKGRRWPGRAELDARQIGMYWPDSVLMRVGESGLPWQFEPLTSDLARGGAKSFHTGAVEFGNPLVMEWILDLGRRTQRVGQPQEEADQFPTREGDTRYRAMTVPLGDSDSSVSHVLCHVAKIGGGG